MSQTKCFNIFFWGDIMFWNDSYFPTFLFTFSSRRIFSYKFCRCAGDEMAEKIQVMGSTPVEEEPLYGLTYLPRKFKAAVAFWWKFKKKSWKIQVSLSLKILRNHHKKYHLSLEVAVAIPPSNDVDLFAHCAGGFCFYVNIIQVNSHPRGTFMASYMFFFYTHNLRTP